MDGLILIVSRDLRDLARTTAFRILAAALALLAVASAVGAAAAAGMADASAAPLAVGTILYFGTLLPYLSLLWAFAGAILAKEKASGHLETLLATPLTPRTLVLAKSAVIALPAFAMAALIAASVAIAAAVAVPPPMAAVCLLGNPLLFSGLGALTVILAMRNSPDAAIAPSFVLGFGLMTLVPLGTALRIVDPSSWTFAAAYLAAGAIEWALVLLLERGLTKERIVLSSRED